MHKRVSLQEQRQGITEMSDFSKKDDTVTKELSLLITTCLHCVFVM